MNTQSSFWSRSYTVIRQRVRLNLYFGETKLTEFNQLVEEAKIEIGKLGLTPSSETMFLASNRAGIHFSCWFTIGGDEAALNALFDELEGQKWKIASD